MWLVPPFSLSGYPNSLLHGYGKRLRIVQKKEWVGRLLRKSSESTGMDCCFQCCPLWSLLIFMWSLSKVPQRDAENNRPLPFQIILAVCWAKYQVSANQWSIIFFTKYLGGIGVKNLDSNKKWFRHNLLNLMNEEKFHKLIKNKYLYIFWNGSITPTYASKRCAQPFY
jgi:hypothetical protein